MPLAGGILVGLVAGYGPHAVAAFGVGLRVEMLSILPFIALGAGMAPFVGQNVGANKRDRIAVALKMALKFCFGVGVLVWLLLAGGRGVLAKAFTNVPEVQAHIELFLLILPLSYGAHGIFFVITSTFNASGQPLRSTVITFIKTPLLSVSLAMAGAHFFGIGGIFGGMALAYLLAAFLSLGVARPHFTGH
jgi:Na+-driven multidrug efflux pump